MKKEWKQQGLKLLMAWYAYGPLTTAEAARRSGLTKVSYRSRAKELEDRGLIKWVRIGSGERVRIKSGKQGRPPGIYELTPEGKFMVINHLKGRE